MQKYDKDQNPDKMTIYITAKRIYPNTLIEPTVIVLQETIRKDYAKKLGKQRTQTGSTKLRTWCEAQIKKRMFYPDWKLVTFSHLKPNRPGIDVSRTDPTYHSSPTYGLLGDEPTP